MIMGGYTTVYLYMAGYTLSNDQSNGHPENNKASTYFLGHLARKRIRVPTIHFQVQTCC